MRRLFLLLILCFVTVVVCRARPSAGSLSYAPCGYGGGGRFTTVAINPKDAQFLLVGSDVAGVFKSTDGGDTFMPKGKGLDGFAVSAIIFHPEQPDMIYLLTDGGLYMSSDGAESWDLINARVKYAQRFFGSTLMVLFDNALWAGTDAGGVFRISLETPKSAPVMTGLAGTKVNCLSINRGVIHAATARGIYRFQDGRWNAANKGLPEGTADMIDMVAHPDGYLYAVEKNSGLYLRDDKAETWVATGTKYSTGFFRGTRTYKSLAVNPQDQKKVFLATHPDSWPFLLFGSQSGGKSWEKVGAFAMANGSPLGWRHPPDAIEALSISPHNSQHMFLADWWNVWRSIDGGGHWQQLTHGLQNVVVYDIKQHPREPDTLFMAVADNGLVKSVDGGKTWTRIMAGVEDGNGVEIELSRPDGRTLYYLLQPWVKKDRVLVYRSTDGGYSWQDVGFSIAGLPLAKLSYVDGMATNLELDPRREGVVYVGTNGYGVFKSEDGGQHWKAVNSGLDPPFIKGPDALLAHPTQPDTLLASTQGGGIHITTNGGKSWMRASAGNEFAFGMAADPFNPGRFIAGCAEKKLLISADGGFTWTTQELPGDRPSHIAAYAVAYDSTVPNKVYAGTLAYGFRAGDGLYGSDDGGKSFSNVALDLPQVSINDLAMKRGTPPRMLIGFNGIGPYCRELRP